MVNHSAAKGKKEGKSNPTSHCHLAIKYFSLIHQPIKQNGLAVVGGTELRDKTTKQTNQNPPSLSLPQTQEQEVSSFWVFWFDLVFSFKVLKQDVTL